MQSLPLLAANGFLGIRPMNQVGSEKVKSYRICFFLDKYFLEYVNAQRHPAV